MLMSLWIPIIAATVALFFASFLSWMVLQLHRQDWVKLAKEDEFLQAVREGPFGRDLAQASVGAVELREYLLVVHPLHGSCPPVRANGAAGSRVALEASISRRPATGCAGSRSAPAPGVGTAAWSGVHRPLAGSASAAVMSNGGRHERDVACIPPFGPSRSRGAAAETVPFGPCWMRGRAPLTAVQ